MAYEVGLADDASREQATAAEYTDRYGAQALKARIEAYWRARGFEVQVMLVEGSFTPQLRSCRVDLRSDLVNGLPRQQVGKPRII